MIAPLLLAALPHVLPANVAGHWEGAMHRGSAELRVSFDFSREMPDRGFFSAPDLGAIDIPLSNVKLGSNVGWDLVGDATTTIFDGTAKGDAMSGTFREGTNAGQFDLHRVSASADKPYTKQDVTFQNGAVRLSGTVFAPRTPGRHPGITFVQGSGAEGRWATAYLADYVARHGIVALTYDKRGVGASTGDWRASTLGDLAADARAGVALLAGRADVNASDVGVYGHSQGAQLSPAIAENNPSVSWIIAADGPVGPQYRQDLYRVDNVLAQHFSGAQLDDAERLYAEFVDVARTAAPHDKLRADIRMAGDAPWLDYLGIPDDQSWIWDWYRGAGNYDNTGAWASVRVPVLLLFGAGDALVPPKQSVAQTLDILRAHDAEPLTVRIFPGADHALRVPPATPDGWPHNAAGFPDVIVTFVRAQQP
jgi:uncharacterized protein